MVHLDIPVTVRWADLDAYGHVNNAAMLTLLEEARIVAFWASEPDDAVASEPNPPAAGGAGASATSRAPAPIDAAAPAHRTALLDAGPGAATRTLIARQEVEYLRPIEYTRAPLTVRLWLSHIGGASVDVCYEVLVASTVHAVALTTIVLVDAVTEAPRRITRAEHAAWSRHLDPPVRFRHRR